MDFSDAFALRLRAQGIATVPNWSPAIYTFSEELYYEPGFPDSFVLKTKNSKFRNRTWHSQDSESSQNTTQRENSDTRDSQSFADDGLDADTDDEYEIDEGKFAKVQSWRKNDTWSGQVKQLREQLALERHDLLKKLVELHTTHMRSEQQLLTLTRNKNPSNFRSGSEDFARTSPSSSSSSSSASVFSASAVKFDRARVETFMFLSGSMLGQSQTNAYGGLHSNATINTKTIAGLTLGSKSQVPFIQASPSSGLTACQSMNSTAQKSIEHLKHRNNLHTKHSKELIETSKEIITTSFSSQKLNKDMSSSITNGTLRSRSFIDSYFIDLDMSNCNISCIDKSITRLSNLQHLNLSHNQLISIDFSLLPASLMTLKIAHNALSDKDELANHSRQIQWEGSFDAHDWSLFETRRSNNNQNDTTRTETEPPRVSSFNAKLVYVSAAFNQFRSLTSLLPIADSLQYLDVSYNQLNNVEECLILLENFCSLKFLYMSGNPVCNDPSFVHRLNEIFANRGQGCVIRAQPMSSSFEALQVSPDNNREEEVLRQSPEYYDRLAKYDSLPDWNENSLEANNITLGSPSASRGGPSSSQYPSIDLDANVESSSVHLPSGNVGKLSRSNSRVAGIAGSSYQSNASGSGAMSSRTPSKKIR